MTGVRNHRQGDLKDSKNDTTSVLAALTDEHLSAIGGSLSANAADLAPGNALMIVTRGGVKESQFLIDSDVTTLGRHPESDIFLDDVTVSRHHAKLVRTAGQLMLEDLGSLNGTYVNRVLIDGRAQLRHGDEIQIGKYRATIPPDSRAGSPHLRSYVSPYLGDSHRGVVEAVATAASGLDRKPAEVALTWARDAPGVASTIVGARTPAQLQGVLSADDLELPVQIRHALDEVTSLQLGYPERF